MAESKLRIDGSFTRAPIILLVLTVSSVFVAEFGVMMLLSPFLAPASVVLFLVDGTLLTVMIFPMLYCLSYRPMNLRILELYRTQERLKEALAEKERTEVNLRNTQAELRNLSARVLTLQEEERRNVSRELHEELAQSLVVLKLQINTIRRGLTGDQEQVRAECVRGQHLIDGMIEGIRRISGDLSPAILNDFGLAKALRRLACGYAGESGLEISAEIEEVDALLPVDRQIILYRIVQESLSNAVSHAGARSISVNIVERRGVLFCRVEDDGKGFDLDEVRREGRCIGLAIMDERARMLGGSLEIRSEPGHGTRVQFSVPAARPGAVPAIS